MLRRVLLFVVIFTSANAVRAIASDETIPTTSTPLKTAVARAATDAEPMLATWAVQKASGRPAALTTLYGTYGALQALDIVSTRRALAAGARERNPLMRGNIAMQVGVKTAAGATTIYFAERMWKKNKAGAIVVMAALNGASAAIVARNQRNARR